LRTPPRMAVPTAESAAQRYIYKRGTKGVTASYYHEIGVKLDHVGAHPTPKCSPLLCRSCLRILLQGFAVPQMYAMLDYLHCTLVA
jgi:hypothetical protein